uniref:Connector enhancer of kinase suppressor of ras 2 n=1 Tax=Acrobeloides nanus TaxID=290746 RepID=A0A914CEK8_9BILA
MKNFPVFRRDFFVAPQERYESIAVPTFQCDSWTENQVIEWLKGVDDAILTYLRAIRKSSINGHGLFLLDHALLKSIGITNDRVRKNVLYAISLLDHYCYIVPEENLQRLSMLVDVATTNLRRSVCNASYVLEDANATTYDSSRLSETLLAVINNVYEVNALVRRLLFWLDRIPFEGVGYYMTIREEINDCMQKILASVNQKNSRFLPISEILIQECDKLMVACNDIFYRMDPCILYTATWEKVVLRRNGPMRWGITFQSVFGGINLITNVEPESPSGLSGKIDIDDEIVQIDGVTVVGWDYKRVREKLDGVIDLQTNRWNIEIEILISKRPRDELTASSGQGKPKTPVLSDSRDTRAKLSLDFQLKLDPDIFKRNDSGHKRQVSRRRSSSFTITNSSYKRQADRLSMPVVQTASAPIPGSDKRLIYRRASIWCDSPPVNFCSMNDRSRKNSETNAIIQILDAWSGHRLSPNGLIANKPKTPSDNLYKPVVEKLENNLIEEEEDESMAFKADGMGDDEEIFAHIEVVESVEIEALNISQPSILDNEWSLPIQEITGLAVNKRLESSSSALSNLDSPLSAIQSKIFRFFGGDSSADSTPAIFTTPEKCETPSLPSLSIREAHTDVPSKVELSSCNNNNTPSLSVNKSITTNPSTAPDIAVFGSTPARISTISGRRMRLAPLAEPDEIGDLDEEHVYSSQFELISASELNIKERETRLQQLATTPCHQLQQKELESWIRRRKSPSEIESQLIQARKVSQWAKVWAVITDEFLLIYPHQFAKEAEIYLSLSGCQLVTTANIKTSKKHVLSLTNENLSLYLAAYSQAEHKSWCEKMLVFANKSYAQESSIYKDYSPCPSSPVEHNTLPRANMFNPSRIINVVRQSSFSGFRPKTPSEVASRGSSTNAEACEGNH